MNRTHALVAALAVSIVLLVPSGAVPLEPFGVDRPDGASATPDGGVPVANGSGDERDTTE